MTTPRTKHTPAKRTTRTARRTTRPTTRGTDAVHAVEGAEPIRDALHADIRLRVSGYAVAAFAIVVLLLVFTAASGVNWFFALITIALAFVAGRFATDAAAGTLRGRCKR